MDSAPAPSALEMISANLRMTLRGLMAALGAWRIEPVIALLVHRRVGQTIGRIERMLLRFRAGKLWRVKQRIVAPGRHVCRKHGAQLPRRFGWLVQMGRHHAACLGLQLQTALTTPEMTELLAASPQAVRVLRPLCQALAVVLPLVTAKAASARGETKPRACKPRVKPLPLHRPLPRGVLSAARQQGFGKLR